MLQHRKKDYLIRLIEEFFKKLQQQADGSKLLTKDEEAAILNDCYTFFEEYFGVSKTDSSEKLIETISDVELLEQYAKLQVTEYDLDENKSDKEGLLKALKIVEYLQNTDSTYSWERTVLREDILHRLDQGI